MTVPVMEEATVDATLLGDVVIAAATEELAPVIFFHPRAYINEDGEVAIWVGTPPGVAPLQPSDLTGEVGVGSALTGTVSHTSSVNTARKEADQRAAIRES